MLRSSSYSELLCESRRDYQDRMPTGAHRSGANDRILAMHSVIPVASVILAIIAAGCIGYIAWEVTKETSSEDDSSDSE